MRQARLPPTNEGENVEPDDAVLRLLASIDRRLALLTASEEQALRQALETDLLRTPARIAMFDSIDGQRAGGELGRIGGVSERTGQLFVKELLDLGVVRPSTNEAAGVVVERDEAAILAWYFSRATGMN